MSETVSSKPANGPAPGVAAKGAVDATISARILALASYITKKRESFLQSADLVPGQDAFLLALLSSDGITMGTLAETLDISASSATKAAIKLENAGLIRREASRVDSRQNYAFLTPAGRDKAREIIFQYEKLDESVFLKLKAKGTERLLKLLDRMEKDNVGAGKQPRKAGSKKSKSRKKSKKDKNSD